MALRHAEVDVKAITTVAGNVPLAQGTQNALYTVELCGSDVPIHEGASSPLIRPLRTAQRVHGEDGMGDIGLDLGGRVPAGDNAVEILADEIAASPGEITLVTLGPLTNIALALRRRPEIADMVRDCIVMGGTSDGRGNVTPVAEYNIWVDPEAAREVFLSGMRLTMVGYDICRNHAEFGPKEIADLKELDTPLAHFTADIQATVMKIMEEREGRPMFRLPDPAAMAVAIEPALVTASERHAVDIETSGELTSGQTVIDWRDQTGGPVNCNVITAISGSGFTRLLHASLS